MKEYKVEVWETVQHIVWVSAIDEDEAYEKAGAEIYNNQFNGEEDTIYDRSFTGEYDVEEIKE